MGGSLTTTDMAALSGDYREAADHAGLVLYASSPDAPPTWLGLHPHFTTVHDYLQRRSPPGLLPGRQHFEPLDIRHVLSSVILIDVLRYEGAMRFHLLVVGTQVVTAWGKEVTGQYVDEAFGPIRGTQAASLCETVVTHRRHRHWRLRNLVTDREFIQMDWAVFPLAKDGHMVDQLLIVQARTPEITALVGQEKPGD